MPVENIFLHALQTANMVSVCVYMCTFALSKQKSTKHGPDKTRVDGIILSNRVQLTCRKSKTREMKQTTKNVCGNFSFISHDLTAARMEWVKIEMIYSNGLFI